MQQKQKPSTALHKEVSGGPEGEEDDREGNCQTCSDTATSHGRQAGEGSPAEAAGGVGTDDEAPAGRGAAWRVPGPERRGSSG